MIVQLAAAAALSARPSARAYRITIHTQPGARIVERVRVPPGWVGAFCTPLVCAVGHVTVVVPASGVAASELHLYRESATAARHFAIFLSAGSSELVLRG
jgi:hypothetical protein